MSAIKGQRLLELAGKYASERGVPSPTIVKELLHYEIIGAMIDHGVAAQLVFQGGTCLRLCYGGARYSEDLDFAGGEGFDPSVMEAFEIGLRKRMADGYGLDLSISAKVNPGDTVALSRYSVKIQVPQTDPSLPQKQVINIEVASVPSHDPVIASIVANYAHLPPHQRTMALLAESEPEILADKIIALGARPFLKYRDVWDLKFLADRRIVLDVRLVKAKIKDYGLEAGAFKRSLEERKAALQAPEAAEGFRAEMSRFVEGKTMGLFGQAAMVKSYMRSPIVYVDEALVGLADMRPKRRLAPS